MAKPPQATPPPQARWPWKPAHAWLLIAAVLALLWLRDLVSWLLPALLLFALWSLMARRLAGQGGLGGLLAVAPSPGV